jgi:hypothetical protein
MSDEPSSRPAFSVPSRYLFGTRVEPQTAKALRTQGFRERDTFQLRSRARFGLLSGVFGRLSSRLVDVWNAAFCSAAFRSAGLT